MGREARRSLSVERAFALLDRVADARHEGIALSELAGMVPSAKSTTHRYVATLLDIGALRRDEFGRLHPGVRLVALAGAFLGDNDLRRASAPILQDLVDLTRETAHLGVRVGSSMVYIDKVESSRSVRLVSQIGARVAVHCSAMGKAALAHVTAEERLSLLALPLEKRTKNTITGEALVEELGRIRQVGYAIDDEENELGVRCLAAPVHANGELLAAVSVSGPAERFGHQRCVALAPRLIELTHEIERRLAHSPVSERREHSKPEIGRPFD